jgi:hypothetical protein
MNPQVSAGELIHAHTVLFRDGDGTIYTVQTWGEERTDGTWAGWVEFHPADPGLPVRATGQETSQPNRDALHYWATGLEPLYFEGAFDRAR